MLIRTTDQALHFLMEAALGLCGVIAIAACIGAWRLAQGPIDITGLVRREQVLMTPPGTRLAIGSAALAWEGFVAGDQPLEIRVHDLSLSSIDASQVVQVRAARVTLSIGNLLVGRIVPRTLAVDGAALLLRRARDGSFPFLAVQQTVEMHRSTKATENIVEELARPVRLGDGLPWLSQLRRVELHNAQATLNDAAFGVAWQAPHVDFAFDRLGGGGRVRPGADRACGRNGAYHAQCTRRIAGGWHPRHGLRYAGLARRDVSVGPRLGCACRRCAAAHGRS